MYLIFNFPYLVIDLIYISSELNSPVFFYLLPWTLFVKLKKSPLTQGFAQENLNQFIFGSLI